MSAQLILSAALLLIVVYAGSQLRSSPLVGVVSMLASATGNYLVWFPGQANAIAHALGIGRGADLLMYCWVVISMAILLNLHFKRRSDRELLTMLIRASAIAEAERDLRSDPGEEAQPLRARRPRVQPPARTRSRAAPVSSRRMP
ncbi:MAG: DUF2304 domain-containing protein [Burkholderiales bacterium]|nr:DUF2304 domain-containing protein [Burkholderiales bacterium]